MIAMFEQVPVFGILHVAIAGEAADDISEMVEVFFENLDDEMDMIRHYDIVVDADSREAVLQGADVIFDKAPDCGISDACVAKSFLFGAEEEREGLDTGLFHKSYEVGAFGAIVVVRAACFMVGFHGGGRFVRDKLIEPAAQFGNEH